MLPFSSYQALPLPDLDGELGCLLRARVLPRLLLVDLQALMQTSKSLQQLAQMATPACWRVVAEASLPRMHPALQSPTGDIPQVACTGHIHQKLNLAAMHAPVLPVLCMIKLLHLHSLPVSSGRNSAVCDSFFLSAGACQMGSHMCPSPQGRSHSPQP